MAKALSRRQQEVLTLAAAGKTNQESARTLGISHATVRGYLVEARARLNACSTCQAVAIAIRMQLI
jgi:two-component system NarL family response regulator